uniref:Uncharacterized protein n=1 Tax=Tanacetum cinerariifolium TaxID=118510 RepID=A0A6L2KWM3_TANCI|nr:hypothetical protein [Tanacetum cinerariifolium]
MKVMKINELERNSDAFDLLKINANLFNCNTPLGVIFDEFGRLSRMDDNLFTYEVKILEPSYAQSVEQQYDKLENDDLDVYEPSWLDLKFRDHKKIDKEFMEEVVNTWLIRSYKKQFEEYMEIKRQFKTKNVLWLYWVIGDDEEVLTDDELSNLKEENMGEGNKIDEIFRIETNIFHFETPLNKAFKESMNGTRKYHGLRKNPGWRMGFGKSILMILIIFIDHFISKVDRLNDPLVIGKKMDMAMEENYQE